MTKKSAPKTNYTKRTATPQIAKDHNGNSLLLCPFCTPPHTLHPSIPSPCGTILVLTAEQVVYKAKYNKKMVCVKCKQGGGEMVRFQGALIHTHNCAPGVMTMTVPPKYSKAAKFVHGMKSPFLKSMLEKYLGRTMPVEEVTPDGSRTGVVLGHFFLKDDDHAKRT